MPADRIDVAYAFFCQYVHADTSGKVTCVGLWGPECRVLASPPAQVDLAFHASIRHSGIVRLTGRLVVSLPNVPPQTMPIDVATTPGSTVTNLNVNLPASPLLDAGEVVARLDLDTVPPATCEVRLKISFHPTG